VHREGPRRPGLDAIARTTWVQSGWLMQTEACQRHSRLVPCGSAAGGRTGDIAAARWVSRRGDLCAWHLQGQHPYAGRNPCVGLVFSRPTTTRSPPRSKSDSSEPGFEAVTTAADGRKALEESARLD
jgi:hypothetical protein